MSETTKTPPERKCIPGGVNTDPTATTATIRGIIEDADTLNPFETEFLTTMLRLARIYRVTFQMTPKQSDMLQQMYDDHVLPKIAQRKTVTPPSSDEPHE